MGYSTDVNATSNDGSAPRPRVLVTRELPGDPLRALRDVADVSVWPERDAPPAEVLRREAQDCDGLLCMLTDRIDGAFLDACPSLRVVSSLSVGVDHIDLAAATQRGVPIGHTPGVLVEATADLTFALLLAAARRIPEADAFVREERWRHWEPDLLLGRELHGRTLGLIGLGAIGQAVARRAQGFGLRVLGWTRSGRRVPGVETTDLDDLLSRSDIVSLHVARSDETVGLLGAAELARLPAGALLINTARGGIVDEAALVEALRSGHLGAAALDVFEREPLPPESPLRSIPRERLVLAPHIGSATEHSRGRMAELAVENLRAGLAGAPLPHLANPDVVPRPAPTGRAH